MRFIKIIIFFLLLLFAVQKVAGKTVEELQKEIETYQQELARLSTQSKTLSNQIAQFDAQIRLTTLKISQTEEKIMLLGGRIDQLETSLDALSNAFSSRAVETYKMAKVGDSFLLLISAPDLTGAVSRFHYLQKIQKADRDLLSRLQAAQITYQGEKTDQEDLQKELGVQKANLNSQKAAKANLLVVTRNDEKRYQQLLSQAQAQLAAFRRFVSSQGGATILTNQTRCDDWGCYYNQRDSEWGNMAIGNSDSSMAEYGCLVTSMAIVASYYDKTLKPSDIAATPSVFFGNTAYMNLGTWVAAGVSTTRTRVCDWCTTDLTRQKIDEELNAGRPVIVGLYSGPDHFIVLKAKEGDDYIMNDPFLENGRNRKLSEKYSFSNIRTVDIIRVN